MGKKYYAMVDQTHRKSFEVGFIEVTAKNPELSYQIGEGIFRRIIKKGVQTSKDAGAAGIKVQISGRIGGAEIARTEWYKEGRIPLHTLRMDIDYAHGRAETTYGSIGVKVWINRGEEVLPLARTGLGG